MCCIVLLLFISIFLLGVVCKIKIGNHNVLTVNNLFLIGSWIWVYLKFKLRIVNRGVVRRNRYFPASHFRRNLVSYILLKVDLVKNNRASKKRFSSRVERKPFRSGCSKTALIKPRLESFPEATVYECSFMLLDKGYAFSSRISR